MALRNIALIICLFATGGSLCASGVELHVRSTVDGKPLLLDSLRYKNTAGEVFSITRLSMLLSGFALQAESGEWEPLSEDPVYLDAASRVTGARIDSALRGKYRAMRFSVGVAPAINHADPSSYAAKHPLNPNYNRLHWDRQGGYIFMALEGLYRGATDTSKDQPSGYVFHLANDHNRTWVNIPMSLDLSSELRVDLDLDVASLLSAPRDVVFTKTPSTHSRKGDPLAGALRVNLASAFQLKKITAQKLNANAVAKLKPLYLPKNPVGFPFKTSSRFPLPDLPGDNPILVSRVALGKKLFHDTALSRDRTISCASCHQTQYALTDARQFSLGVGGKVGTRNSMPLFNLAWKKEFFWDGRASSIRQQVLIPIQDHQEMDMQMPVLMKRLISSEQYRKDFTKAFGTEEITAEKVSLALENFLLTLTSYRSEFDQAVAGKGKLSEQEKRGFELFMTEYEPRSEQYGADCFHCHGGALFSDHQFHNNGLEPANGDTGRFQVTAKASDKGKFATPSLRNVALTAPYMHDGRFKTLEEVVRHYNSGLHRSETLDPNLAKHPPAGLGLSEDDMQALVAFLKTLTDSQFTPSDSP